MKTFKAIAVGLLMVLCVALLLERAQGEAVEPTQLLPSPRDIQRQINSLTEYNLTVDGKIGPYTMQTWGTAYGNQSASVYFESED